MRFKQIEYHPHAAMRMAQRRIASNQIVLTLEHPDREFPGHTAPRIVAERDLPTGNTIRVVYLTRDGGTTAYVLTVLRRRTHP